MSDYVIGLTGGIGSGKTAVSDYLQSLGIDIVDADLASRVVVEPGQPALTAIAEHFGASILLADGNLDRAALRQKIFSDPAAKQWLEQLLHPLIAAEIDRQLKAASSPYAVLVSPLLLETSQHQRVDRILLIDVPEALQLERASARDNNSAEQIKAIMAAQMSRAERQSRVDDVICNDGSLADLHSKTAALHQSYLAAATQAKNV